MEKKDIIWVLKNENVYLSCGLRWLYWDETGKQWVVYEQTGRKPSALYKGDNQEKAVAALIKE